MIAIIAIGINSLGIGYPAPGNEAIINIHQNSRFNDNDGNISYDLSFTLTNAPKEVDTYSAKVTWYGTNGEVLMTTFKDLKNELVEDDHTVDIQVYKNHSPIDIEDCVIEITNNQGELVTSTNYKWIDNN